jgi:hypothetical protein
MDNEMAGFWLVAAVVLFVFAGFAVFVAATIPGSTWQQARQAITQCEAQIPRNMRCVVTATPEQEAKTGA